MLPAAILLSWPPRQPTVLLNLLTLGQATLLGSVTGWCAEVTACHLKPRLRDAEYSRLFPCTSAFPVRTPCLSQHAGPSRKMGNKWNGATPAVQPEAELAQLLSQAIRENEMLPFVCRCDAEFCDM